MGFITGSTVFKFIIASITIEAVLLYSNFIIYKALATVLSVQQMLYAG